MHYTIFPRSVVTIKTSSCDILRQNVFQLSCSDKDNNPSCCSEADTCCADVKAKIPLPHASERRSFCNFSTSDKFLDTKWHDDKETFPLTCLKMDTWNRCEDVLSPLKKLQQLSLRKDKETFSLTCHEMVHGTGVKMFCRP